jgi:mycothiol synthase
MENKLTFKIVSGSEAMAVVSRFASVGRSGVDHEKAKVSFLEFLSRYNIDASRQAAAFLKDRMVGYSLCLVNPGATASVFLPETFPDLDPGYLYFEVASKTLRCLVDCLEAWDLAVLQTMVVDENAPLARIFFEAGFGVLCRLNILEAGVGLETSEESMEDIGWLSYGQVSEDRFSDLILETYEASKDCPRLTGLRTGREILAGHRSSGLFEPDGWAILQFRRRDAGVLLLNNTEEEPERMELVYMGLAPWARGADLGDLLLNQAFRIARRKGKKTIRLAVDCENTPALRLYRHFGFKEAARQTVLAVLNESRGNTIKERNHGR